MKTSKSVKNLWRANCAITREFDEMILTKDEEIVELEHQWQVDLVRFP